MLEDDPFEWHEGAACRGTDSSVFMPIGDDRQGWSDAPAKAICAECPVIDDCLDWAMGQPGTSEGVWGGLSKGERLGLRKRLSKRARLERAGQGRMSL